MENHTGVDLYLESLSVENKKALSHVRELIQATVPDAIEVISYKMPAYKYHGMLVGYAAHKDHCSFYLWKNGSIEYFREDLIEFSISAGTIRFTADQPNPDELLVRIIKFREQENLEKKNRK